MFKKLQARNMRIVYNHPFFKLIRVSEPGKENLKPLIFINGQIDHHLQAMETATKATYPWCYQYSGYYKYDDSVHTPYIFLYDYPIYNIDRTSVSNQAFCEGLLQALQELGLENVDIMGMSNGGMIGIMVSNNPRVDQVIAMHPPIYGAPCLQLDEYTKLAKIMSVKERLLISAIKLVTDSKFGYMQSNKTGFENIEEVGDISKIFVTTSNIIKTPSKNGLASTLAEMHKKYLGIDSDGVVACDEDRMKSDGLNYHLEDSISHFEMGNIEYTQNYYSILTRHK